MNSSIHTPIVKVRDSHPTETEDIIAVEEPLEIILESGSHNDRTSRNLAVTMRTPGNDVELALGFIFTEGIINRYDEVNKIEHDTTSCTEDKQNRILVSLHEHIVPNLSNTERNFYTTSSCGVCGKASINAIRTINTSRHHFTNEGQIDGDIFLGLPNMLLNQQKIFAETGGLHSSAIFNHHGELLLLREDVGRHNALDKLIGSCLAQKDFYFEHSILLLSGRASFELIQKAVMAGISVVAAIGAPSSLAVSLAKEFGISLVGFLRNNRFNIYAGEQRIKIKSHENSY